MQNKSFGRLEETTIVFATTPLNVNGEYIWTNDPAIYAGEGYLPVQHNAKPSREGYWYDQTWVEQDGVIVQTWVEHEIPPTDQISDAEALAIITGGAAV